MIEFLFVADADFQLDPDDSAKVLTGDAADVIRTARAALETLQQWTTADIEQALRSSLIEGLGLKPKLAFGPVRLAITGRRVSPPLFESMELLGREKSLARLDQGIRAAAQ